MQGAFCLSRISIVREHGTSRARARTAVERVAAEIKAKHEMTCQWDGDRLEFHRLGARGVLEISDETVSIDVHLAMLLAPMRHRIQAAMERELDRAIEAG